MSSPLLRQEVRVLAASWRPGYGPWKGFVVKEVVVDSAGETICHLRSHWDRAARDRETAERGAQALIAEGRGPEWIRVGRLRRRD